MPGKIFVNYRRDDSGANALAVAQHLMRMFGESNVFLDVDRVRAGQDFVTELNDRLSDCKVMIAVIGPSWLTVTDEEGKRRLDDPEDWVRLELADALRRKIAVIPVLVGGAAMPKKSDLPYNLRPLLQRQVATITTNGFRHEMAGLVSDIKAISARPWRMTTAVVSAALIGAVALTIGLINGQSHMQSLPSVGGQLAPDARPKAEDDHKKITDAWPISPGARRQVYKHGRQGNLQRTTFLPNFIRPV